MNKEALAPLQIHTSKHGSASGFTLIELLVVVAILAVVATVVVLAVNPVEYIRQSRDAKRVADLTALDKAVELFDMNNAANSTATMASTTVYLSLPDTSPTCGSHALPILPSGYQYHCVPAANLQRTDGAGWIPLNLAALPGGAGLAVLPVDPVNAAAGSKFYSFVPGGSFEFAGAMESTMYGLGGVRDAVSKDGGSKTNLYETGTNLSLLPVDYGDPALANDWQFEEGSGPVVQDGSGNGNNGQWNGNGNHYGQAKQGKYGGDFDDSGDYFSVPNIDLANSDFTVEGWIKPTAIGSGDMPLFSRCAANTTGQCLKLLVRNGKLYMSFYGIDTAGATTLVPGQWQHVAFVYDKEQRTQAIYLNGARDAQGVGKDPFIGAPGTATIGYDALNHFNGKLDTISIYTKTLSDKAIRSIYEE